jgi:hypothetical protein
VEGEVKRAARDGCREEERGRKDLAGLRPSLLASWRAAAPRGEEQLLLLLAAERWDEPEEEEEEVLLLPGERKAAKGKFSLFSGSRLRSSASKAVLLTAVVVVEEWRRIRLGMLVMLERGVSGLLVWGGCRSGGLGVDPLLLDSLSMDRRR